jgi:rSAM/selenodomain-associated transferase 2
LSIIIPVLNEAEGVVAVLMALSPLRERGVEVIVVDGGSHDDSVDLARPWVDRLVSAPWGRARQMNVGAACADGEILLFLHADTYLPEYADQLIRRAMQAGAIWGRFDVRIEGHHRMLCVVAAMMNWRSRWTGIATGDQAIFVRREVFDSLGGFPDQPLMEDVEFSARLCSIASPVCLRDCVLTSGRRWEKHGVWRTIVLMWQLRWRYWRGESPQLLAKAYR